MKTIKTFITISLMVFFVSSCDKSNVGPKGKDGNANVISKTFTVNQWTNTSGKWVASLSVPEITNDNFNTAAVQLFFSTSGTSWKAVPFTEVASTNYFMNFSVEVSKISIEWIYNGITSGSSPNTFYGISNSSFKVVVIPPAFIKQHPNINLYDHNELMKAIN